MILRLLTAAILSSVAFVLWAVTVPSVSGPSNESQSNISEYAVVTQIIDGDTVMINDTTKVRYIGIDTPELNPHGVSECFAQEAARRNQELVLGKNVRLVQDVSKTDQYGRLLRYLYLNEMTSSIYENTTINEILVREGLAVARSYPPDIEKQSLLREAESDARTSARGFWAPDACK